MRTVEGTELGAKDLAMLDAGEEPTFAARPTFATVGAGGHWSTPLLVLTTRRLVLSKDRLLGKPKADFAVSWPEVRAVSGELWNGGGPQIQLIVDTARAQVELIVPPEHAVDVESAIRSGYLT